MKARHTIPLSLGLAVGVLVFMAAVASPTVGAAGRGAPEDQGFRINNMTGEEFGLPVTVRVLHSDGSLQKSETIWMGDTHRFTFNWCNDCCGHDKKRKFEIKINTFPSLKATGELNMTTKNPEAGWLAADPCVEKNVMTVTDLDPNDEWYFETDYTSDHRTAILNVKMKLRR